MLRIIVQRQVGKAWYNTDLAYNLDAVLDIVRARMHEKLSANEKPIKGLFGKVKEIKREWNMEEIEAAFDEAGRFFIKEFRGKTAGII